MSQPTAKDRSEIEVRPMHRIARVPLHLTKGRVRRFAMALVGLDIVFIAAYLATTMPEVRALTMTGRLASLDLAVSANLPWTYELAKLAAIAAFCALMAFSYAGDQTPDRYWRFGAFVATVLAVAHAARGYEIWAASVVPTILGPEIAPSVAVAVGRLGLFALLIGGATTLFPARSRGAFVWLCLAVVVLLAAEFGPPAVLTTAVTAPIAPSVATTAWHVGLRLFGESLILIGLTGGVRDIQIAAVRYVYRGES